MTVATISYHKYAYYKQIHEFPHLNNVRIRHNSIKCLNFRPRLGKYHCMPKISYGGFVVSSINYGHTNVYINTHTHTQTCVHCSARQIRWFGGDIHQNLSISKPNLIVWWLS